MSLTLKDYSAKEDFDYVFNLSRNEIGTQQPNVEKNFGEKDIRRRLNKNETLIIYYKGQRVGFMSYRVVNPLPFPFLANFKTKRVFLDLIALEGSAQHHGIGLEAVKELEKNAAKEGITTIYGHVLKTNEKALNAWKKIGSKVIGKRFGYLILEKKILNDTNRKMEAGS